MSELKGAEAWQFIRMGNPERGAGKAGQEAGDPLAERLPAALES